jgi:uncharacterized repeat protein (TIGR03803 family)
MKEGLPMTKLNGWKKPFAIFLFCAVAAIASSTQTFTTLQQFDGTDGVQPYGGLVQATNGDL